MGAAAAALEIEDVLDPQEELDFVLDTTGLLEEGEQIQAGYTLAVLSAGGALGVTLMSDGVDGSGYDHGLIEANRKIRFWLKVDAGYQTNAAWDGEGTVIAMQITFTTNASPTRTRDRLFLVRVAQLGKVSS